MVYPDTGLPLVVEIAPGASPASDPGSWPWVDVTSSARVADGITISEGRTDWGAKVDAGSISMVFDNRTGDFSEWNPLGQWYGLLGRDTPLRVRIRRADDQFGRTASNGWGTADSGQTWTTAGSAAGDYSVTSGAAKHSHGTINILRSTRLGVQLLDCEQVVDASAPALMTGAALVTGLIFRSQDAGTYYWLRTEFNPGATTVMLKISKSVSGTITDLAVLNGVPGLAYAANAPLRTRASVVGSSLAIKVWPASGQEPSGWQLTATDTAITAPGQTGIQSWVVAGNTNTVPVVATFDSYALHIDLAGGYVPAWVPRWDALGKIRTVPVVAKGVLYRTQPATGTPPKRSAMRRTIAASRPVAYWPLEDGVVAGQAASAVPGCPGMGTTGNVTFAPVDDVTGPALGQTVTLRYGTSALAELSAGGSLRSGSLPASVTAACASAWTVAATSEVQYDQISGDLVLLEVETPGGTYVRWQLVISRTPTTAEQVVGYDAAGVSTVLTTTSTTSTQFITRAMSVQQSGGSLTVALYRHSTSPTSSATVAGTLTGPTAVTVNPGRVTSVVKMWVGHVPVFASAGIPYAILGHFAGDYESGDAYQAYRGEPPADRLTRLSGEDGVPLTVITPPTDVDATRMGWQPIEDPATLYQQCVQVDGGVLAEQPFRLLYTPRASLYNQSPALTMTSDQLAAEPEPDPTDQAYRNRIEASRVDGSSAPAEAPEVAGGAILYSDSINLSLNSDLPLSNHAGWRLHLASTRGLRWPRLALNLAATPELIDAWLNCRPGSRIQVTAPPQDVAGQDIDVLLEGHTTVLGYKDWDVTANFSAAAVWDVAVAGGAQRAGAEGSTLASSLAAGALSLSVASTVANGIWTVDPVDYPLDVRVGGERVTVGAVGQVLNTNSWFETDVSGWTAFGATATRSTAQAHQGSASLLLTPDGVSSGPRVECGSRPASVGAQYRLSAWVRCGSSRTVGLSINWFDSASVYLSTSSAPSVAVTAGVWTLLTFTATAPASTGRISGNVLLSGVAPTTDLLHIDEAVLVPVSTYATSPQTMTIAPGGRGVNGVSRTWPTGTEVDVWYPAVSAL